MSVLELDQFGVAFGEKVILSSINLNIQVKGLMKLMGPCGTGKSTLLRTICGHNDANTNLRTWGRATYAGSDLCDPDRPRLVAQDARLLMSTVQENILFDLPEKTDLSIRQKSELAKRLLDGSGLNELSDSLDMPAVKLSLAQQRHLAIARSIAANPRLLCIDEPTATLDDKDSSRILSYIEKEAERRAILLVLHSQLQSKQTSGKIALMAGGHIQHIASTRNFFAKPENELVQDFIKTGSLSLPSPNAKPEELDPEFNVSRAKKAMPKAAKNYRRETFGPRGFLWLKKGLLAGTPMPGVVASQESDLRALKRVGIKVLFSLTEQCFPPEKLEPYEIKGEWLPIDDMDSPQIDDCLHVCKQVEGFMAQGLAVAFHCKAGLGRTGTMLAAQLIYEGCTALEALETVRLIEPRWVQSDKQIIFLDELERIAESGKGYHPH